MKPAERLCVDDAMDRLRDWVANLDLDELARVISEHCHPRGADGGAVVVFDNYSDEESAPYMDGRRCRWVCVPEVITTTGKGE